MHAEIPLTRSIDVQVTAYDGTALTLSAPLAMNANHKGTAFGGSLFSLAVLAGWGLLVLKLGERHLDAELVIQDSSVQYLSPVRGDFSAQARFPDADEFERFVRTLAAAARLGRELRVLISHGGRDAVRFEGTFAAIKA
jgi:thioesterase domain-containing protein